MSFPHPGPTDGSIVANSATQPQLPAIGTYQVSFQVSVDEAGQLVVGLDSGAGVQQLGYTVVGRAAGTSLIVETVLVQTTVVNSVLTIRNPVGNPSALTVTPLAGGTDGSSSSLIIEQIR